MSTLRTDAAIAAGLAAIIVALVPGMALVAIGSIAAILAYAVIALLRGRGPTSPAASRSPGPRRYTG